MALSFQMINVGTVANDGTGDPLRTAFIKVNTNYGTIDAGFTSINAVLPKDINGNPIPAAPLDSPHFTGDPTAPNPAPGDDDTSLATTSWVKALIHDPDLSGLAPIASPHFSGDPTAPTPATIDNDTSIATTAFVKAAIAAGAGGGGGISPTPPPTPVPGQFWYDLTTGVLSLWVDDGNTSQWVAITPLITST